MIVLDFGPGEPGEAIDARARDALAMLRLARSAVPSIVHGRMSHNGVRVEVWPDDSAEFLVHRYRVGRDEQDAHRQAEQDEHVPRHRAGDPS